MAVLVDRGRARASLQKEARRGKPPVLAGDHERSSRLAILGLELRPRIKESSERFLVASEGGETHRSDSEGVSRVRVRSRREELPRHGGMTFLAGQHERRRALRAALLDVGAGEKLLAYGLELPLERDFEKTLGWALSAEQPENQSQHFAAVILARTPSEVLLAKAVAPHHGVERPLVHPGEVSCYDGRA